MLRFIFAEVANMKFHRYSEEKTMIWLEKKVVVTKHKRLCSVLVSDIGVSCSFCVWWCRWRGPSLRSRREISTLERESNPRHTSEWSQNQTTRRVSPLSLPMERHLQASFPHFQQRGRWPIDGSNIASFISAVMIVEQTSNYKKHKVGSYFNYCRCLVSVIQRTTCATPTASYQSTSVKIWAKPSSNTCSKFRPLWSWSVLNVRALLKIKRASFVPPRRLPELTSPKEAEPPSKVRRCRLSLLFPRCRSCSACFV